MEGQLPGPQAYKKLGRGSQESADRWDIAWSSWHAAIRGGAGTLPSGVGRAPGAHVCVMCVDTGQSTLQAPNLGSPESHRTHYWGQPRREFPSWKEGLGGESWTFSSFLWPPPP